MKYKELLERLKQLSEAQLEQGVVFMTEERGFEISQLEILSENLYGDVDCPEDGCYPLELGVSADEYDLIYSFGTPILID